MDNFTESLTNLELDSSDVINTAPIADSIERLVVWVVVPLAVFGTLLLVLYILHLIQVHRVNRAILEMQKDLHELNERDRARSA